MTSMLEILTAATAVALAGAGLHAAEDAEHKFEKAAGYYDECVASTAEEFDRIREDVKAFTDMAIMASTMNDPEKFFRLMNVVNDPRNIHVMASCATEPVMWDTWMQNGTSPEKWTDAAANMMNRAGWMKWMRAPMNPTIWEEVAAHADPEKYDRWATAFVKPAFYSPVTNMLDLEWYEPRLAWMTNADSFAPIYEMFMASSD